MLLKILTFETGEVLEIYRDDDPFCPRKDCDHLGTMVFAHKRYKLGDTEHDFGEASEINPKNFPVCLPVYMYDHSGITISTEPFSCPWDSGQLGWILVTEEDMRYEYKNINEETIEIARKVLLSEIHVYDQFLRGNTLGFVLKKDDCEEDSCWGFIGDDLTENGILDHLPGHIQKQFKEEEYTQKEGA